MVMGGGRKRKKQREILQQCLIFCNRKGNQEKRDRSREYKVRETADLDPLPLLPPPYTSQKLLEVRFKYLCTT